jgi:hypothetical protein
MVESACDMKLQHRRLLVVLVRTGASRTSGSTSRWLERVVMIGMSDLHVPAGPPEEP